MKIHEGTKVFILGIDKLVVRLQDAEGYLSFKFADVFWPVPVHPDGTHKTPKAPALPVVEYTCRL